MTSPRSKVKYTLLDDSSMPKNRETMEDNVPPLHLKHSNSAEDSVMEIPQKRTVTKLGNPKTHVSSEEDSGLNIWCCCFKKKPQHSKTTSKDQLEQLIRRSKQNR